MSSLPALRVSVRPSYVASGEAMTYSAPLALQVSAAWNARTNQAISFDKFAASAAAAVAVVVVFVSVCMLAHGCSRTNEVIARRAVLLALSGRQQATRWAAHL